MKKLSYLDYIPLLFIVAVVGGVSIISLIAVALFGVAFWTMYALLMTYVFIHIVVKLVDDVKEKIGD